LKKFLTASLAGALSCIHALAQDTSTHSDWYRFSEDGKECIVNRSELPTPWLNRLSNDVFTTWITHNGYIESYLLDPDYNGLTNPQNTSGRFYIRDKETGNHFQVNTHTENGKWQGRVGLGYNVVSQQVGDLNASVTYFVPRNDNVLVMLLEVENTGTADRIIDVFSEVEWNLGDPVKSFIYRGDGRGGSQFNLYKKVEMENNALLATMRTWRSTGTCVPWPFTGYFSVSEPVVSYECIKDNFLGLQRDYDNPLALTNERLTNTAFWSQAEYPVGVLQNTVTVPAGAKKKLSYVLGMAHDDKNVKNAVAKYVSVDAADKALKELNAFYDKFIDQSVTVETPDKANDRILNIWTKYHWRQFYKKSLNNGAYGLGLWSYGLEGETIRTAVEQVILPFDMDIIGSSIGDHFKNQMSDTGQTDISIGAHTMLYKDLGIKGPNANHKGKELITHRHKISEFFYPVYFYLQETGDLSLLDKTFPYIDGKEATVWEHIRTAMTIATRILSERGLPRVPTGHGDWMDEFTRISKNNSAESVMLAGELGFILKGFIDIAKRSNHYEDAKAWQAIYDKIKNAVNQYGWDGEWYTRAFSDRYDTLTPVGTHNDKEGKIYINSQSWSVLSGIATPERGKTALMSLKKNLLCEFGPKVFSPSYTNYVDHIGTQSIYAPGFRNGCIYLRPTGWAVMAAVMTGQPEMAYEFYSNASLATRGKNIVQYECEPYVYPELYNGPDHRLKGRGEFQWNLGEGASWMWYSYVNYILGVRAEIDGLRIDPRIPADWNGFKMTRMFRGSKYEIEVKRVSKNKMITVDGKKVKGNLLPAGEKGKTYKVTVAL
jgi:cellobiose phosphorylase